MKGRFRGRTVIRALAVAATSAAKSGYLLVGKTAVMLTS
jgi:hypothetical protein